MRILCIVSILSFSSISCTEHDIYTNIQSIKSGDNKIIVIPYHRDSLTIELIENNYEDFNKF